MCAHCIIMTKKEIRALLENPGCDRAQILRRHRSLLLLKRERLDGLLRLLDESVKGENTMSFEAFDMSKIEQAKKEYAEEARARWGETEPYQESARRSKNYGEQEWAEISAAQEEIYRAFAALKDSEAPDSPAAQEQARRWQALITQYFYPCTDEILAGLGEMYVADERFTASLDAYGAGTAQFISDAIAVYCRDQKCN